MVFLKKQRYYLHSSELEGLSVCGPTQVMSLELLTVAKQS